MFYMRTRIKQKHQQTKEQTKMDIYVMKASSLNQQRKRENKSVNSREKKITSCVSIRARACVRFKIFCSFAQS